MFAKKPSPEELELNAAITKAHSDLTFYPAHSDEYAAIADQLVKLYAQKEKIPSNRFSRDQLLAVSGNLAGILVIVMYESRNVMTSKATSFIMKASR